MSQVGSLTLHSHTHTLQIFGTHSFWFLESWDQSNAFALRPFRCFQAQVKLSLAEYLPLLLRPIIVAELDEAENARRGLSMVVVPPRRHRWSFSAAWWLRAIPFLRFFGWSRSMAIPFSSNQFLWHKVWRFQIIHTNVQQTGVRSSVWSHPGLSKKH